MWRACWRGPLTHGLEHPLPRVLVHLRAAAAVRQRRPSAAAGAAAPWLPRGTFLSTRRQASRRLAVVAQHERVAPVAAPALLAGHLCAAGACQPHSPRRPRAHCTRRSGGVPCRDLMSASVLEPAPPGLPEDSPTTGRSSKSSGAAPAWQCCSPPAAGGPAGCRLSQALPSRWQATQGRAAVRLGWTGEHGSAGSLSCPKAVCGRCQRQKAGWRAGKFLRAWPVCCALPCCTQGGKKLCARARQRRPIGLSRPRGHRGQGLEIRPKSFQWRRLGGGGPGA